MAKKTWRAKQGCVTGFGVIDKGDVIELDDSQVDDRIRKLFECMTADEVKAENDAKKDDPDLRVMVGRLKAAKIPMKRGITKAEVKELFDKFLAVDTTAGKIAEDVKL